MLQSLRERDGAERLRALGVARVRDALAVLLAVARVVERRVRLERAAVERRRRRHDLERRPRRIETLRRAVEQRRRERARGRADARDRGEALLDRVRVVGRARRDREDPPGLRLDRDGCAALPAQRPHGRLLRAQVEREVDVVSLDRDARELVELVLRDARDVAVRAREVVVLGALEPGAGAALRRVADDVRGEVAVGVLAEVVRLAGDLLLHVRREQHASVAGVDLAAVDRERRDPGERVVLPVREAGDRERLPVRRADDQRAEQDDRANGEARDLPVHASPRSVLARFETSIRPASKTKFATTLEPP